jgi:hypothetical protein
MATSSSFPVIANNIPIVVFVGSSALFLWVMAKRAAFRRDCGLENSLNSNKRDSTAMLVASATYWGLVTAIWVFFQWKLSPLFGPMLSSPDLPFLSRVVYTVSPIAASGILLILCAGGWLVHRRLPPSIIRATLPWCFVPLGVITVFFLFAAFFLPVFRDGAVGPI